MVKKKKKGLKLLDVNDLQKTFLPLQNAHCHHRTCFFSTLNSSLSVAINKPFCRKLKCVILVILFPQLGYSAISFPRLAMLLK